MVAEHIVGQPGRARGQRDHRVQPVGDQRRLDRDAGEPGGVSAQFPVAGVGEAAAGRFGLLEQLLAEARQDQLRVALVEADELGEGPGMVARQPSQVGADAVLKLVQQRSELWEFHLVHARELHRIDHDRAPLAEPRHRAVQHGGRRRTRSGRSVPPDPDPSPAQRPGLAATGVVGRTGAAAGRRAIILASGILGVGGGQDGQQRRRVGHRPGHRARGVLGR